MKVNDEVYNKDHPGIKGIIVRLASDDAYGNKWVSVKFNQKIKFITSPSPAKQIWVCPIEDLILIDEKFAIGKEET